MPLSTPKNTTCYERLPNIISRDVPIGFSALGVCEMNTVCLCAAENYQMDME